MALQHDRIIEVADAWQRHAEKVQELHSEALELLALNSNLAIDWGAGEKPSYIDEEVNGNLSGRTFSRQQVANAIFSIQQTVNVLANQAVVQGDHLGNINQLASA